ncbi:carboxymuconolactone decarboxylase family protein [Pseudoduganella ginsengisoli]|uniref:Carboxymuconolactone decarboxylase family protein n=1 Tax=Pseudoduganella ginsengisoli TaxID=1462440 RepID=A0A6L6PV98_9BURK|nr:carboxymuconolactone decarboxylase family protein [Pseudoduganella ginsengisoli]MTW01417.1 carboxymuconolactone decarboxylase family protein [Pseudoduganella ginsengisoli]
MQAHTPRIDFYAAAPDAMKAMMAMEVAIGKLGLEPALVELIKLRASQINGCAYCVDLHAGDMRKQGESERRITGVSVWRETPFYTPRERAALAWTEALTLLAQTHAPDADYAALAEHFTPAEMVAVTMAVNSINNWNRFGVGFRKLPTL